MSDDERLLTELRAHGMTAETADFLSTRRAALAR